jgi:LAO/AO transport system kinase
LSGAASTAPRADASAAALAARLLDGDRRALARAMTLVEDGTPAGRRVLQSLYGRTGRAWRVGVTGFPGAGKSSLVDQLAAVYRQEGRRVGVAAVDPSSAFSGGAILGDRIRMMRHALDEGVFIRSLATRGQFGGLSKATHDVVDLLDAAGYDRTLIETVGVGQDEIDIVRTADTVLVVLVPGLGDDIQAIKAGVLEIADIFVINKADHEGADRLERELTAMIALAPDGEATPIVRTVATQGVGIGLLAAAIADGRARAEASGALRRRRRLHAESRFLGLLRDRLVEGALARLGGAGAYVQLVDGVADRRLDPYAAVERMLAGLDPGGPRMTGRLDHLGIAVPGLEDALRIWRDALGLRPTRTETVEEQGVRTMLLPAGECAVELLEPTGPETPVGRFLERRGPGLHHVCLSVPDLDAALERLRALGLRLVDPRPRRGAGGSRIAFLHPASTGGVLVELKEAAPAATRRDG